MAGFPGTPSRISLGPTYVDKYPVRDQSRELGADAMNLAFWQVAGAGRTVPKMVLLLDPGSDGPARVAYQALAWDPDGLLPPLAVVRASTGVYEVTLAPSYPDERGVATPFLPVFGLAAATGDPRYVAGASCNGFVVTVRVLDGAEAPVDSFVGLMVWG